MKVAVDYQYSVAHEIDVCITILTVDPEHPWVDLFTPGYSTFNRQLPIREPPGLGSPHLFGSFSTLEIAQTWVQDILGLLREYDIKKRQLYRNRSKLPERYEIAI